MNTISYLSNRYKSIGSQKEFFTMLEELTGRKYQSEREWLYQELTNLPAGVLLNACLYWSGKKKVIENDGWFYKTYDAWKNDNHISRGQITRSLKLWKGAIETKFKRVAGHPKMHYRINYENLISVFLERLEICTNKNIYKIDSIIEYFDLSLNLHTVNTFNLHTVNTFNLHTIGTLLGTLTNSLINNNNYLPEILAEGIEIKLPEMEMAELQILNQSLTTQPESTNPVQPFQTLLEESSKNPEGCAGAPREATMRNPQSSGNNGHKDTSSVFRGGEEALDEDAPSPQKEIRNKTNKGLVGFLAIKDCSEQENKLRVALGEQFLRVAGMVYKPSGKDRSLWYQEIAKWIEIGATEIDVKTIIYYMRQKDLPIANIHSIRGLLMSHIAKKTFVPEAVGFDITGMGATYNVGDPLPWNMEIGA